jgi:hypothetical protein
LTWFGRPLSDEKIAEYLADETKPRQIQHALTQIEQRIEKGDPTVKKFYPRIIELTKSPTGEVRKTAAWVMGQDNKSEEFHQALLPLLKDPEPLVRRNVALQLVRFGDASGRPELLQMLRPFEAKSPVAGTIASILPQGSRLRAGSMLARIRDDSGNLHEFRAPIDGTLSTQVAKENTRVNVNDTVAWITPDRGSLLGALHALAYVGTADDVALIEPVKQIDASAEVTQQTKQTIEAIQSRSRR